MERSNTWVYEPAGGPPDRPPEALPQGAEQGGQWTYHSGRQNWYYEPPVADAGAGAAQVQQSGSADAPTVVTGADAARLTDTQQEVANHVAKLLAGGGVLTAYQQQRLVEMGILEPGEDAATGETAADAGAGAAQVQQSGSANAATGETGADSDLTDTQQEVANHVAQFLAGGGVLTADQQQRLVEMGILEPGTDNNITPGTQSQPAVPDAGSNSEAADIFALHDSGSKPRGSLTREQGTSNWYNASLLEDDSGINLVGASYALMNDNTIVADGTVSIGNGTARVHTTYTRNPDGTITTQSRLINHYKDDAAGSGGGGGSSREYTVADDGTVSYTEGAHTYTVSDEGLGQAVRDAAASGDTSGLSAVDQVTVSGGEGSIVEANAAAAAEAAQSLAADASALLESQGREFNPEFVEYAAQYGLTPEQLLVGHGR